MTFARALTLLAAAWLALILVGAGRAVLPISWPLALPGPDVVLVAVVYVGLQTSGDLGRGGTVPVVALALLLGYFADLFSGAPKGMHMIVYAVAGLAARGASVRILVRGRLLTAFVCGLFALVVGALTVALRTSLTPSLGWGALRSVPLSALITALVAPLEFRVLRRLDRRFVRDPRLLTRGPA